MGIEGIILEVISQLRNTLGKRMCNYFVNVDEESAGEIIFISEERFRGEF